MYSRERSDSAAARRERPFFVNERLHSTAVKTTSTLAILFLAAAAFAAEPPPAPNERWSRLQLGNITVYGNAGDRTLRTVAENLVRFRDTVAQVQRIPVQSPLPTYVYVFQNEASFAPYRIAAVGKRSPDVVGVFAQQAGANWMLIQARSDVAFDRLVYHELTHYFIRNTLPGVRPWLDEGLAGFYETFAPMGRSNVVTIGKPPYKYLDVLRQMGLMPLPELFAQHPLRDHSSSDPRVTQFYLQSWLLVHYLLIGNPERGAALGPFLAELDEGKSLERSFADAFHMKMEDLNGELSAYLRRDRFNMIQYTVAASGDKIGEPAAMPRQETFFVLGDLLAHTDPAAGAEAFLTQAVRLNPNHGAATAALARVKSIAGKSDEARQLYEKAIAVAGKDPRPYVAASLHTVAALQRRARDGEHVERAEVEKARGQAMTALSLAPDDVLANAILGATYTFAGEEPKKGIAASRRAFELAPSMLDVAADLVLLYARSGLPALATDVIDRVLVPSGDDQYLAEARENLALADYLRAEELLQANEKGQARTLLDRAAKATVNEKLKAKIAAARGGAS